MCNSSSCRKKCRGIRRGRMRSNSMVPLPNLTIHPPLSPLYLLSTTFLINLHPPPSFFRFTPLVSLVETISGCKVILSSFVDHKNLFHVMWKNSFLHGEWERSRFVSFLTIVEFRRSCEFISKNFEKKLIFTQGMEKFRFVSFWES